MPVSLEGLSPCYGLSPPTPCCDPSLCAVPPLQAVSPLWFNGHGQVHAQLSPALPRSTMPLPEGSRTAPAGSAALPRAKPHQGAIGCSSSWL